MALSSQNSSPPFTVLYEASGMAPVRMLNIVACAFCVGGVGMAGLLLRAPRQQSISDTSAVVWAGVLLSAALLAPVVAWLHGRKVAAKLLLSADGQTLRIVQPSLFGSTSRDVAVRDLQLTAVEPGDASGEKALSPSRLEIRVRDGHNFLVTLNQGTEQRRRIIEALRQR
jgi:hypothetical protein